MNEFKIGDRVKLTEPILSMERALNGHEDYMIDAGLLGTVKRVAGYKHIVVAFDDGSWTDLGDGKRFEKVQS